MSLRKLATKCTILATFFSMVISVAPVNAAANFTVAFKLPQGCSAGSRDSDPEIDPNNRSFVNGILIIVCNGKYGAVDTTGKIVIKPSFQSLGNFSSGLAPASNSTATFAPYGVTSMPKSWKGSVYGYVDAKGNWKIKPAFEVAGRFSDGLARVVLKDNQHTEGFIDTTGKLVIKLGPYGGSEISTNPNADFHGGFFSFSTIDAAPVNVGSSYAPTSTLPASARARLSGGPSADSFCAPSFGSDIQDSLWPRTLATGSFPRLTSVTINTQGIVVIAHQYTDVQQFQDGLAEAMIADCNSQNSGIEWMGYIDTSGNKVITFPVSQYDQAYFNSGFHENEAVLGDNQSTITTDGTIIPGAGQIDPYSNWYSNGLIVIGGKNPNSMCGYQDVNGKIVIPETYFNCQNFSEGYASVLIASSRNSKDNHGRFTYIDTNGIPISQNFWQASPIAQGLAPVCVSINSCEVLKVQS